MVRTLLFWLHLVAGLGAGLVLASLCLTGAVIAFQHEIVAWAERAERSVVPPTAGAERLPLAELQRRFRAALPRARLASVHVAADPTQAVLFRYGPVNTPATTAYANPYTGEVRTPPRSFADRALRFAVEWHRWLSLSGERRPLGKALTGAGTLVAIALTLTGLYLWWPRPWSRRRLRAILWFRRGVRGRARAYLWHHVVGLWTAPLLLLIALTSLPIAYKWATAGIYAAHGEKEPAANSLPPFKGQAKVDLDRIVALAAAEVPDWQTIAINYPVGYNGNRANAGIRRADAWPRAAWRALTFDPVTGDIVRRDGWEQASPGRRFWWWTRMLHTGEAVGWPGQAVELLGALGGLLLVYTGVTLAVRRGHRWRRGRAERSTTGRSTAGAR